MHTRSGHLKMLVMQILSEKSMSGYALMKEVERKTGIWRPSSGSMYPLLDSLIKDKLARSKKQGRRNIYSLTMKGERYILDMKKRRDEWINSMIQNMKVMENFVGFGQTGFIIEVLEGLKRGEVPFKSLHKEIGEFRKQLTRLHIHTDDTHHAKIRKILQNATGELKKIR